MSWSFTNDKRFDADTERELMEALAPSYINGLTLLGGEPMEPVNQEALLPFIKKVRERMPKKSIWCFTGYDFERDILGRMMKESQMTRDLVALFDVMVDGKFVEEKKNLSLRFRGSENQRILDVKKSLEEGRAVWAEEL